MSSKQPTAVEVGLIAMGRSFSGFRLSAARQDQFVTCHRKITEQGFPSSRDTYWVPGYMPTNHLLRKEKHSLWGVVFARLLGWDWAFAQTLGSPDLFNPDHTTRVTIIWLREVWSISTITWWGLGGWVAVGGLEWCHPRHWLLSRLRRERYLS